MSFEEFHPISISLYFLIVMGISMVVSNLFVIFVSLICGLIYNTVLFGFKKLGKYIALTSMLVSVMVIVNGIFVHQGETILLYFNENPITLESLSFGAYSGIKFSSMIIWFNLLNKALDGEKISYLFGRVSSLFSLMLSMILRYIPILKRRYLEIEQGQKYLINDNKSIINSLEAGAKRLSVLISWSLESSIDTGISMESRGYGIGKRSSFHLFKWEIRDSIFCFSIAILTIFFISSYIVYEMEDFFYPKLIIQSYESIYDFILIVAFSIVCILPILLDVVEEIRWRKL